LSLGEGQHGLERRLGTILQIDVHGVQETDRTLPTVVVVIVVVDAREGGVVG
jgi:hypothetical protein